LFGVFWGGGVRHKYQRIIVHLSETRLHSDLSIHSELCFGGEGAPQIYIYIYYFFWIDNCPLEWNKAWFCVCASDTKWCMYIYVDGMGADARCQCMVTLKHVITRHTCLIFIGHFPQKSPRFSSSFAKNDLQLKASHDAHPQNESRLWCMVATMNSSSTFVQKSYWF